MTLSSTVAKRSAQPAAALQRLPLYLYGQNATQVSTDGPALLVRIVDKAPLRYPFARLARVIASTRVEWRADALTACQQHGLPIVFVDGTGTPTGYLQPMQGKPSRLHDVIEEMLDRADWRMHYSHWLRAERMALLHDWAVAREGAGKEVDMGEFRELVRRHVYRPETESLAFAPHSPQAGALAAYTLQALHQAGLQTRYWDERGAPLELAGDLTRLLGLALHLEMLGLGTAMHGDNTALLSVLHSFGKRINQLVPHLLGRLHRRLKSQVEEWR